MLSAMKRRGGRQIVDTSIDMDLLPCLEAGPTPAQAAELLDEARRLLDCVLDNRKGILCAIATRKLQGQSNSGLARDLGVSRRTIERKLELIRVLWKEDIDARESSVNQ